MIIQKNRLYVNLDSAGSDEIAEARKALEEAEQALRDKNKQVNQQVKVLDADKLDKTKTEHQKMIFDAGMLTEEEYKAKYLKILDTNREDKVNHPSHYTFGKYEVINVLQDWFPNDPLLWQVAKYIARAAHKDNFLEDLKKARFYLEKRIAQVEDSEIKLQKKQNTEKAYELNMSSTKEELKDAIKASNLYAGAVRRVIPKIP